jgi:hypothetical protein
VTVTDSLGETSAQSSPATVSVYVPVIYVSPASINNAVTNNYYTVYVHVANVVDLYAWELQLNYNSTMLRLVSYSNVSGGLNTPTQIFENSNTSTGGVGQVWFAISTIHPTSTGITYADHAIFQIQFEAIAAGASSLHLHGDILSDPTGTPIAHNTTDGSITVGTLDLTVTSIIVINNGCSIYANDTYADGITPYYVPVNVTIQNTGSMNAGSFNVSLAAYSFNSSRADGYGELRVTSLTAGGSLTLQFTTVFHPTHFGYYNLTATVDVHNEVVESNKTNNVLVYSPRAQVTIIGDINGDGVVNILDAVAIAQAWHATSSNSWWNIKADINHDGTVDIFDGTRLTLNWGKTG